VDRAAGDAVSLWIFGQRGLIVEHDPATREPLEGGIVTGCTAVQFGMSGITEVVADQMLPGALAEFWPDGWVTDGSHRFRLVHENGET
jgi:hypothetical protein